MQQIHGLKYLSQKKKMNSSVEWTCRSVLNLLWSHSCRNLLHLHVATKFWFTQLWVFVNKDKSQCCAFRRCIVLIKHSFFLFFSKIKCQNFFESIKWQSIVCFMCSALNKIYFVPPESLLLSLQKGSRAKWVRLDCMR